MIQMMSKPASGVLEARVATRHFYFVESPTFLFGVDTGRSQLSDYVNYSLLVGNS